jgi:hypothetical protein
MQTDRPSCIPPSTIFLTLERGALQKEQQGSVIFPAPVVGHVPSRESQKTHNPAEGAKDEGERYGGVHGSLGSSQ